jgi:hypothetical protein
MAIDAAYHRTRIEALYVELAKLDGTVDGTDMGRSQLFNYTRKTLMDQIEWHKEQLADDEGPYELVTVAY